jgi:putative transposase
MEPDDKYTGKELSNIEVLQEFISRRETQKIMRTYLKVAFALSAILGKTERISQVLKNDLSSFVLTVQRYSKNIDLKLILRLCKVPISVYYSWRNRVLKPCETSPVGLCKKTWPHQLTANETSIMKNLLLDERFRFWPVCSIAFYAIREKILSISLPTWYLYQKKLGITRPKLPKKKKYTTGISAHRPNQVWHADITIVKTKDNIKHYVYLLMDNFSKFILTWRIEPYISGKVRMETISEAYNEYGSESEGIDLVFDGGPENNNDEMKAFVDKEGVRINPLIALKDIPYSNSLIEAQNKLFKYRYLFRQEYEDIHGLRKVFSENVRDYNYIRPHLSLAGYTPFEAYSGMTGLQYIWKEQIQEARRERLRVNSEEICRVCK